MSKSKNLNAAVNLLSAIAVFVFAVAAIGIFILVGSSDSGDYSASDQKAGQFDKQNDGAKSQNEVPDTKSKSLPAEPELDFSNDFPTSELPQTEVFEPTVENTPFFPC